MRRRQLGNSATRQLAGAIILFASTWSYAEVSPPLQSRLNDARLEAPQAVNDWLDEFTEQATEIYGLVQVQDGGWCAITAGTDGRPNAPRCIQPETGEEQSLSERFQAKQAADAARRGAMSEQMHQHLHAHPNTLTEALVWARFTPPPREAGARLDPEPLQAGLLALCDAHPPCRATAMPGVPAVSLTASVGLFRQLARNPLVGAIDYVDPAVEIVEQVGGPEMTMECVRIDEANASFPTVDGTGIKIAVIEGGMPFPAQTALIDPTMTTNCPGVTTAWHGGQTLSVIKGDSSGDDTPRAIEGSASGADLLVAGRSEGCFPCNSNADCSGNITCNAVTGLCNYAGDGHRLFAAMSWAAAQGADVINGSLSEKWLACNSDETGEYDYISRTLDYWPTQSPWPVVTKTSGNRGNDRVSGGTTYNGIVVGGVDHLNEIDRSQHQIWNTSSCAHCESLSYPDCTSDNDCSSVDIGCSGPFSCDSNKTYASCTANIFCEWQYTCRGGSGSQGRNRLSGSLEVPHVVAPAREVLVLRSTGNWSAGSGTSWAAPHVAGIAARILQIANHAFDWYPEAVRAILLATATEDVHGISLRLSDTVDDLDGAGEVDALEAELVASSSTSAHQCWGSEAAPCSTRGANWGSMHSSDFDTSDYYTHELHFTPGFNTNTAQIALTWMVNVTCDPQQLTCTGDPWAPMTLEMTLQKKSAYIWTTVDWSLVPSANNNYLFIRTAVDASAQYRLLIKYPGQVANRLTFFGLAWTTYK